VSSNNVGNSIELINAM